VGCDVTGLCGAALHIATGYHGQARSMKDIARILRVSADTIKKRYDGTEHLIA
jgi:transcription initiation factor TFIIIB Brf1 subunit/transcription initiation factor TFIIB